MVAILIINFIVFIIKWISNTVAISFQLVWLSFFWKYKILYVCLNTSAHFRKQINTDKDLSFHKVYDALETFNCTTLNHPNYYYITRIYKW